MTNLLSAQQQLVTEAGARAGWLWRWKSLQPSPTWINFVEDKMEKSHAECQPREGAAAPGSINTNSQRSHFISPRWTGSPEQGLDRGSDPRPLPSAHLDPQGLLMPCSPVDLR